MEPIRPALVWRKAKFHVMKPIVVGKMPKYVIQPTALSPESFMFCISSGANGKTARVAGLVIGLVTGAAVIISPLSGPVIDRFGARATATIAGFALAAGYAGLAFSHSPVQAFIAAAFAGIGNGALNPSQSTLLAVLAPPDIRHRVTAVSRVASNAGIGLGGALGGMMAGYGLTGFILLFLANALTYLVYVFVLLAVVRKDVRTEPSAGGYRLVVRDRAFLHLALTNIAIIAVGWGAFTWLVPPYAEAQIGIRTQLIGFLLLANAVTVVIAQVPIAKFAEGKRRMVMMAISTVIFVFACLLVVFAGSQNNLAYMALLAASILVAIGECFHTSVLMPLVADLAPNNLRGRYMAAIGLSWWVGLALAPTFGTQLLSISPSVTFLLAGAISILAAISALMLEQRLPESARLTPRPPVDEAAITELQRAKSID